MAGDVARAFRGQEGDGLRDFEVGAGTAKGDGGHHGRALFLVEHSRHGGFNVPRGHGVDGDAARGYLAGKRARQADEAGF